ncbi:MAG: hypothetical protein CEO12_394 [Parcubacteria group bacterium Gr01-1014_46]|nr:MAG: hypothetical protein CEO12_394 [Parcubacteria group bacterium Gr01-1014_46]
MTDPWNRPPEFYAAPGKAAAEGFLILIALCAAKFLTWKFAYGSGADTFLTNWGPMVILAAIIVPGVRHARDGM